MINEILRQDENGRTEAEFGEPHALAPLFSDPAHGTHCLQYIDPYGDTVFNRGQISQLIAEIGARVAGLSDDVQVHAEALLTFLRAAADDVHTYVKFIGD